MPFEVTFWGVRGTVPCPFPGHMRYGGNTSCVQVEVAGRTIILDGGTGLRPLGKRLVETGVRQATLLLSHLHLDHVSGFPFFAPGFSPGFSCAVRSACRDGEPDLRSVLGGLMEPPLFPVPLRNLEADFSFDGFEPGAVLDLGDGIRVRTLPLHHPGGSTGYRIEHAGRSLAYVTDTEHIPGRTDHRLLELIAGADLVIYDTTYTEEEWRHRVGWGHSTWNEGVRLCRLAGAHRLALFHHNPDHDDDFMEGMENQARAAWTGAFAAREGLTLALTDQR
jgi:phosphoribosyl 1,2-cyclic phosphodiesterase